MAVANSRAKKFIRLLEGQDATVNKIFTMEDFRNSIITVSTTGFTGTLKIYGGVADGPMLNQSTVTPYIDITAAASEDNPYSGIQMIDLNTGNAVDGTTGVTYTITTDVQSYEINTNALDFIIVKLTRTAGTLSAFMRAVDND